jgi:hypothetical protein
LEFFAYGGTRFEMRNSVGDLATKLGLPAGLLRDTHEILIDREKKLSKTCFGSSSKNGQRFLVLRHRTFDDRGGYGYSFVFDLGEEVYKSVNYNYALIIDKILKNPDLENKILHNPEQLTKEDFKVLADSDWEEDLSNRPGLDEEIKGYSQALVVQEPIIKPFNDWEKDWITPSQMSEALGKLSPEERKDFNWMVGAGGTWQRLAGVKVAYSYIKS